jgi:hypothetical protein
MDGDAAPLKIEIHVNGRSAAMVRQAARALGTDETSAACLLLGMGAGWLAKHPYWQPEDRQTREGATHADW